MKEIVNEITTIFSAAEEDTSRIYEEKEHEVRGKFDRDRDRILNSRAFRRLTGKTQVFLSGQDEHLRNRMTHTLEVSQVARSIAKALGLNERLAEASALGHDLGHTPFGHVGERTLNYIMNGCDTIRDFSDSLVTGQGFKHNWQSIRVVTQLEKYNEYQGLNLTKYTLWGILNHCGLAYRGCENRMEGSNKCMLRREGKTCHKADRKFSLDFYSKYTEFIDPEDITIEGLIVWLSDQIAQRHHDVEDALETNVISFNELYGKIGELYVSDGNRKAYERILDYHDEEVRIARLGSFVVNLLTQNAIDNIKKYLCSIIKEKQLSSREDFLNMKKDEGFRRELKENIYLDNSMRKQDEKFQKYICNRILNSYKAQSMDGKGNYIIRQLFKAYIINPQRLPDKTIKILFRTLQSGNIIEKDFNIDNVGDCRERLNILHSSDDMSYKNILMRTVCDFIAGMTDRYAISIYSDLYEAVRLS